MVVPLLVPCDFANVDIGVEEFHREGAESLVLAKEEKEKEEGLGCLCLYVVYLLDLMLKTRRVHNN